MGGAADAVGGAVRSVGRAVDPTTGRGLANIATGGAYEMNRQIVDAAGNVVGGVAPTADQVNPADPRFTNTFQATAPVIAHRSTPTFVNDRYAAPTNGFTASTPQNTFSASAGPSVGTVQQAQLQSLEGNAGVQAATRAALDSSAANATAARQTSLASALEAQANGQGPSLAQLQLQQGTDRVQRQMAGAIAAQRGINPALAARLITQNGAAMSQEAAGQAATTRMQEQLQARGLLAQALSAQRGQDIGQQGLATQTAGTLGGLANQQNALTLQNTLGTNELNQRAAIANQGANLQAQGINANVAAGNQQAALAAQGMNLQGALANQQAQTASNALNANISQGNQQAWMANEQLNTQIAMGNANLAQGAQQINANVASGNQNAQTNLAAINAGVSQANAQTQAGMIGGLLNAGGAIAGGLLMSDERVKEHVTRHGDEVMPGVPRASFEYKGDPTHQRYEGVIAQDVERVAPELVAEGADGVKRVPAALGPTPMHAAGGEIGTGPGFDFLRRLDTGATGRRLNEGISGAGASFAGALARRGGGAGAPGFEPSTGRVENSPLLSSVPGSSDPEAPIEGYEWSPPYFGGELPMAEGGRVSLGAALARGGGGVPGRARRPGVDDERNDTVHALLTPGEIVLPLSVASAPDAPRRAAAFVQALQNRAR